MKARYRATALAATGILAFTGAAACSSNSSGNSNASASKPIASLSSLNGVHTQVYLASSFVQALQSLNVTPAPVGNATISKAGVATFPITGGNVTYYKPHSRYPYVTGAIDHQGSGLSLTAGGKTIILENFVVNPGTSKLTGDVVEGSKTLHNVYLFFLNGSTLQPLTKPTPSTGVLYGTKVYLSSDAATALNQYFGINALNSKVLIGTAKITVSLT